MYTYRGIRGERGGSLLESVATVAERLQPKSFARRRVEELFAGADVRVDGERPWDMRIGDDRLFTRLLAGGSRAFGDAYVDGWWDTDRLDELVTRLLRADVASQVTSPKFVLAAAGAQLTNLVKSKRRDARAVSHHYDIGNDLYEKMLDPSMTYSCGYFRGTDDLQRAQRQKYDLVCRKIGLQSGDRVLDVGCGWGGFANFAAREYGAEVVGVTLSKPQLQRAQRVCRDLPVEIRLQDYRDLDESFDHIVSIGMFEHVGPVNYRRYMEVINDCLADGGLFLLHTIGTNESKGHINPWIHENIFPNACLPSIHQIGAATEGLFVMEDWHNFGPDYDRTLLAWFQRFDESWDQIAEDYGERFYRMWKFYLLGCAGSFRARVNQLWQIVLSKEGTVQRYRPVR